MQGYVLAAAGSVGLVASLWLPWYSFQIPAGALDEAAQRAHQLGVLAPLVSQTAAMIARLGPLHVTAWQVFTVTPAALLAVGVIAGGLSLLALTGRAGGAARIVARVGVTGIATTGYRLAMPPGQGDALHTSWGLYLGFAGAAAVLAGGLLAIAGDRVSAPGPATLDLSHPAPAAPQVPWPTASSVAPPGS